MQSTCCSQFHVKLMPNFSVYTTLGTFSYAGTSALYIQLVFTAATAMYPFQSRIMMHFLEVHRTRMT